MASIAVSADGTGVLCCADLGATVRVHDLATGDDTGVGLPSLSLLGGRRSGYPPGAGPLGHVAVSGDGRYVVHSYRRALQVWDLPAERRVGPVWRLRRPWLLAGSCGIAALAVDGSGDRFVVAGSEGARSRGVVMIGELAGAARVGGPWVTERGVVAVAFGPGGRVAAGDEAGRLLEHDGGDGGHLAVSTTVVHPYVDEPLAVSAVSGMSRLPDGRLLTCGANGITMHAPDGTALPLWDPDPTAGGVRNMAVTADGAVIAWVGRGDRRIRVHHLASGDRIDGPWEEYDFPAEIVVGATPAGPTSAVLVARERAPFPSLRAWPLPTSPPS